MFEEENIDYSKYKYALYARKSTDDPKRQARSIPDQIEDCEKLAERLGLTIKGEPLTEKRSAKKPNQRPVFTQLLRDLRNGKYDGVISWNPDRLARNMKEGGEIIDMLDENIIKDMRFVTHHFSKDANGKMLLGMAFVLSKQYSDSLSQTVTRGVRKNFAEGKTPAPKHGYTRDNNGNYKPDEKSFDLIVKAWKLREGGTSIEGIVEFLNKNNYQRETKEGKVIKMTKQMLSKMFKDPFYYGILVHQKTGAKVDLREAYNFIPAISEETYNRVQSLSYRRLKPNKPHNQAFYPLKAMVICSFCGSNMYVAPSTGHTKRYLNARCDNKSCTRKKKSIRMINIFNFIYDFLEKGLNFSEKEFIEYQSNLIKHSGIKRGELTIEIHRKEALLKSIHNEKRQRSLGIIKTKEGSEIWKENEKRINELVEEHEDIETQLKNLRTQLTQPEEDTLTIEQFLNLSKNAANIVKSANAVVKDEICRLIFLNFTVDEEKVLSYQAKEPFATLLKQRELLSSRGKRT